MLILSLNDFDNFRFYYFHLFAGADVEYRDVWSGERKMSASQFRDFFPSNYTTQVHLYFF